MRQPSENQSNHPETPLPPPPEKGIEEDLTLFQTLINQSNDGIFIVSPETSRILYVNDKVCSNLGYTRDELLAMRIIDIALNVHNIESWRKLVRRVKSHGSALFETEQKRKNGRRMPVEINVRLIAHDGAEYLVSLARDITERKRAEDAFLEEKNKLEAVIAAIGDGITLQDTNLRILYQNTLQKEMQGDHLGEFCYRAYQQRDTVCEGCLLIKSFQDGKVHRRETTAPTDRGLIHLEVTSSPIQDARGEIMGGIEIIRDITERKRLEARLAQAQKMEAVGQLAGGVAHDFNNILTAIIGYADLLQMKLRETDPLQSDVDRILNSAERGAHLTRSLLAFSKRQVIKMKPVNVNEIVMRMEELLVRLIGADVDLSTTLSEEELVVLADTGQIEQVLMNLATNARDAMPQGGRLSISSSGAVLGDDFIRAHGYGRSGAFALITVVDTGAGMDDRTIGCIFEPFFTTKEVGKGTGLGLSIVYGVIKQHNGYIAVRSAPGEGTAFNIYLPLTDARAQPDAQTITAPPRRGTETILIAEDSADVRNLVRATLEKFGYAVIESVDGDDAVRKFKEHGDRIHLLILDVIMPKRNGRNAFDAIRQLRPGIKALFMSGYAADILSKEGIPEELNFLSKPFSTERLLTMVRRVLNDAPREAPSPGDDDG